MLPSIVVTLTTILISPPSSTYRYKTVREMIETILFLFLLEWTYSRKKIWCVCVITQRSTRKRKIMSHKLQCLCTHRERLETHTKEKRGTCSKKPLKPGCMELDILPNLAQYLYFLGGRSSLLSNEEHWPGPWCACNTTGEI